MVLVIRNTQSTLRIMKYLVNTFNTPTHSTQTPDWKRRLQESWDWFRSCSHVFVYVFSATASFLIRQFAGQAALPESVFIVSFVLYKYLFIAGGLSQPLIDYCWEVFDYWLWMVRFGRDLIWAIVRFPKWFKMLCLKSPPVLSNFQSNLQAYIFEYQQFKQFLFYLFKSIYVCYCDCNPQP